ncbi:LON peptidase substrate-binding domain-containing protein [Niabella beijingensis]|uniref:LON peptidase substrate-binding domain-containing protein n=1 Tax=Niabella beijingensis TaxID=2872700 RepID=UPI001CC121E1|nr:LON peptidase substrate-binding domain-containing protein [Niabella beijingensis]MBZ4189549.1 LON peptidase substrate-binding domain-containing protein [Niabella beijingensis]
MTNFIPIFPLSIVVFPEERLNLHIFEPRYKQLIQESATSKKPFGIPVVMDDKLQEWGSLVYVEEIATVYENGEMDIKTRGGDLFRILEVIKEIPEKLYSGAIVNYPENDRKGNPRVMQLLVQQMRALHNYLQVKKDFKKQENLLTAYDIAHHSGLTIYEEYEFLQLTRERQRQEYLKRHFEKTLPVFEQMNQLKQRIQMNGHFKNLSGFDIK